MPPLVLPLMALLAAAHAYLDALPNFIMRKMPLFTSSVADVRLALSVLAGSTQESLLNLAEYKIEEVDLFMNQFRFELGNGVGAIAEWIRDQPASTGAIHTALLSGMEDLATEASPDKNCWVLAIKNFAKEVMEAMVHSQMQEAVLGLRRRNS